MGRATEFLDFLTSDNVDGTAYSNLEIRDKNGKIHKKYLKIRRQYLKEKRRTEMSNTLKCPLCGSDKLVRRAELSANTKEFIRWHIEWCSLTKTDETMLWCGENDCGFKMDCFDGTQASIDDKDNHYTFEEE